MEGGGNDKTASQLKLCGIMPVYGEYRNEKKNIKWDFYLYFRCTFIPPTIVLGVHCAGIAVRH
jgi:hypothetical protein